MQPDDLIGIIGAGVVGGALRTYLQDQGATARVYDPPKGHADLAAVNEASTIFVCVPTPYTTGRGFDDGYLLEAVASLSASKTVVIKSTVLPGTTSLLQARYPQHRFMFNPEFLRDGVESVEGDEVVLRLISPLRPGLLQPVDNEDFRYLVMPIRLNV